MTELLQSAVPPAAQAYAGAAAPERLPIRTPMNARRAVTWLRKNLFSSWLDAGITVAIGAVLLIVVPKALDWIFFSAVFSGEQRSDCRVDAACWIPIRQFMNYFIYGPFPDEEAWRVNTAFVIAGLTFPLLFSRRIPQKLLVGYIIVLPVVLWLLLKGGLILSTIPTSALGGLVLTFFLGVIAMCLSLPVAILLAMGRRSQLPIVRWTCIFYIELVRAIPVLTFLFMASVMLQLFLPGGMTVDVIFRILFVLIFVSAAYKAEIIRGAIQALPSGQVEASYAMGCGYWKTMIYIVMPQALRNSIPALISNFIGLFKETTLVVILGLLEVVGVVRATFENAEWIGLHTEGMLLISFFFVVICYSIAQYGAFLERGIKSTRH